MKKYIVYKVAVLLLCTALLTGCGQKDKAALPEDFPIDFVFSSGVGAWATSMTLEQDGAFSGEYYDADMGVCDEDYPNGTVYICDFSGRFSDIEKVDEYSYSLRLAELDSDYEETFAFSPLEQAKAISQTPPFFLQLPKKDVSVSDLEHLGKADAEEAHKTPKKAADIKTSVFFITFILTDKKLHERRNTVAWSYSCNISASPYTAR